MTQPAPEGRTPATAAGRALLNDLVEHVESLSPNDRDAMYEATTTALLAIEAEAAAGVRVAEAISVDLREVAA